MHSSVRRSVPLVNAVVLTIALIAPLAAGAQGDAAADSVATEGTGVARISLIDGDVAVQRGDSADSLAAVRNTPVLGGDYVITGDASRAEIQLDGFVQLRLDRNTQLRFTHLDPDDQSVQLAAGTINLRQATADGAREIDTPSIAVQPRQRGSYRVTVTPDGATLVTVRSGDATIITPQSRQDLLPGSTVIAQGDAANPAIRIEAAVASDDFDRFNRDRDGALAAARAGVGYVDPRIGGLEELTSGGRWVSDGSYGNVWVPAATRPGWAPYRDGRWVWEDGYGWTWLAAESWGWAPYHYGSWYDSPRYGWCWFPPRPRVFVPWRPALVAFIGFGAGTGFALGFTGGGGFGQIGWVPLAPSEPYRPWWGDQYGRGPTVVNNTNITNVTYVTNVNVYRNARSNAVSSVSSQQFLQGNFARNVAVSARQLRAAHVFRGAIPVVPTASNLRFSPVAAAPPVAVRTGLRAGTFAGKPAVIARTPFGAQRVAFATAAHTAITPLHFKDARTTPIQPAAQTGVGRMPAHSAGLPETSTSARRYTAGHQPVNAPTRGMNPGETGLGHAPPPVVDDRSQSGATLDREASPRRPSYKPATPSYQPSVPYRAPSAPSHHRAVPDDQPAPHHEQIAPYHEQTAPSGQQIAPRRERIMPPYHQQAAPDRHPAATDTGRGARTTTTLPHEAGRPNADAEPAAAPSVVHPDAHPKVHEKPAQSQAHPPRGAFIPQRVPARATAYRAQHTERAGLRTRRA